MRLSTHAILSLWRDRPDWAPTFMELGAALGVRKSQGRRLQSLVDHLLEEGALERAGNRLRFGAPRAASGVVGEAAGRGARRVPVSSARAEPGSLVGVFSAHPNGFGFVEMTGERDAVFVPPRYIAGALDGDKVRVQRRPARRGERGSGRILEVLERRHSHIRGHVQLEYGQVWVAPLSEKLPLVFIAEGEESPPWPDGALVAVEIVAYPEHPDEAPDGRIVEVFDEGAEAPEQVVLHILGDLNLSPDFSPATHAEMRRLTGQPRPELADPGQSGREDQRGLPFVTIDGEDARDFDDAVCLRLLDGGVRRLWVAIADVAAYVAQGSAVDGDAYRKGTSVYFPNQVFPMLPEGLSNDLCSLRPNEPRLTLTCEMDFDADGQRIGYRIVEGLIESRARLTYNRVQALFESREDAALGKDLRAMLGEMRTLARQLRERRDARGALDFSFPEFRFELDNKGWPQRVREVYATEATRLIEQFMLEANETVAEHCAKAEVPILFRVHDPPPPDQLKNLAVTLLNFGVELRGEDLARPGGIKQLLGRIVEHPQRQAIEVAILRSLSQAQYRASNDGHFALAATYYTHFTSPIRRYPDLLVHRALKASLGGRRRPFTLAADAGLHTSVCERTAGEAENRVIRLYKVLYMEPHLGETFAATVSGLSERGLWLRLRDEPVDGLLPMMSLPIAPPRYDRERSQLITRGQRRNIGLGDTLRVTLARADRLTQQIEFAFLGWGWEAPEEDGGTRAGAVPERTHAGAAAPGERASARREKQGGKSPQGGKAAKGKSQAKGGKAKPGKSSKRGRATSPPKGGGKGRGRR